MRISTFRNSHGPVRRTGPSHLTTVPGPGPALHHIKEKNMNGPVRRPYRKRYDPNVLAYVNDRDSMHSQGIIKPGDVVLVIAHYGPFRRIRTETGEWSVGKGSLKAVQ